MIFVERVLMMKIYPLILFFAASALCGQTPSGYTLTKTGVTSSGSHPATVSFQWIASNPTSNGGNFFILADIPNRMELESVVLSGPDSSLLQGPSKSTASSVTIGPFPVGANASVTLEARETMLSGTPGGEPGSTGETFTLLPASRLLDSKANSASSLLALGEGTPTAGGLLLSVVAGPNISNGGQPVNFFVNLSGPARINLALYTLTGERVFNLETQGNPGMNTLTWAVRNDAHEPVASGLYLYYLQVSGGGTAETKTGKILILH